MTPDELERFCLALPGTTADIKWEHNRVYSVGGKMFALVNLFGPAAGQVAFKVGPERFLALTDRPGIIPAPYLARHYWICIVGPQVLRDAEWRELLRLSYGLVVAKLPKRLRPSAL